MAHELPHGVEGDRHASPYEALVSLVAGLSVSGTQCVYVSTPITTGATFYEFWARNWPGRRVLTAEQRQQATAHAMAENMEAADREINLLKSAGLSGVFINPSHLVVPGWSQGEYLDFWLTVIDRVVDSLVFVPGWQFSAGSVIEYTHAVRIGKSVMDNQLRAIPLAEAIDGVAQARSSVESMGLPTDVLSMRLRDLRQLQS